MAVGGIKCTGPRQVASRALRAIDCSEQRLVASSTLGATRRSYGTEVLFGFVDEGGCREHSLTSGETGMQWHRPIHSVPAADGFRTIGANYGISCLYDCVPASSGYGRH